MLRRIELPSNNVETSVEYILRGAKKRRSMAMVANEMINEHDVQNMLVAIK